MAGVITIPKEFQAEIKATKAGVSALADSLGAARVRSRDLGPKVIGLYDRMKASIGRGFNFVGFARLYDPTVPTHADARDGVEGYRRHKTYYALDYMRRTMQAEDSPRGKAAGVRNNATDALARALATILSIVPKASVESIWTAVQKEFDFGEGLMTRLRDRVVKTQPLFSLQAQRVKVGNVIHMERPVTTSAEGKVAAAPIADVEKPRRRVKIPA